MKKLFSTLLLSFLSIVTWAQDSKNDSLVISKAWILTVDLVNQVDNYPALLLAGEKLVSKDFSVVIEAGPVIVPESYWQESFDRYFGFKSRVAARLYYHYNHRKKLRDFVAMDIGFHGDWYEMQYDVSLGNFSRIEEGEFKRSILDYHLRWGRQRFLLDSRKLILEWSIGIGVQRMSFKEPDTNGGFIFTASDITSESDIGPLSGNIRIKIGYLLGASPVKSKLSK